MTLWRFIQPFQLQGTAGKKDSDFFSLSLSLYYTWKRITPYSNKKIKLNVLKHSLYLRRKKYIVTYQYLLCRTIYYLNIVALKEAITFAEMYIDYHINRKKEKNIYHEIL